MSSNRRQSSAFTLILIVCFAVSAFAQRTTGTLRGQVLDPQGAVVGGASVTVTSEATGVSQVVTTSSAGTWNLPTMLPGKYTVTVAASGFSKFTSREVPVLVDQDNVSDAHLSLGSASEVVEVAAAAAQIETTSSSLNNNFDTNQVENVPVVGGTVYSVLNLAILAPNTIAQPGGTVGEGGAIGGTRPRDNNFTVDGVDDNNLGVTGPNSTVIFDAVQEFALQTNQFSAEYGHSAGGQFNLVTKSGTNAYHGSGEWYAQNRNFNSLDNLTKAAILNNTPGVTQQPPYDNERGGGTFGGPIIKDKLFFFGAYEFTNLHGAGSPTNLTAPTAAGLSALQSMAADSAVSDILVNFPVAPAMTNTVTVNGQAIPIGPLTIISPVLNREHDVQANLDYHLGKHQLGSRFLLNQSTQIFPANDTQAIFNQDLLFRNRKIALTDAWTITNTAVNDLRLQYAYFSQFFTNHCPTCAHQDVTILDLGNTTIGPTDPAWQKQSTYQITDNLTWVHGKHTFKFGGQYNHFIYPQFFLPRSNGDNWYKSTQEFINDLEPTQPGRTLRGAGSGYFLGTQSLIAGFVQDDVKVTPRLTLNLGVRYEFWTNPVGNKLQTLNAISNVPNVITFGLPKTDTNNIGPRIGFAYDPTGSGKTAIRGGFGISYDVKFQNFASITLPPQIQSEMDTTTACLIANPPAWCSAGPLGNGFLAAGGLPAVLTPPTTQADARALTTSYIDDTVMPKILTWSLGVQHEVARNSSIEVRYLGTRGLLLPVQDRRNFISYFDAGGTALPTFLSAASIPSSWASSTPTDVNYYTYTSNYGNCGTTTPVTPIAGFSSPTPDIYQQYGFCGIVTSDPSIGSSIYHAGSVNFTHRAGHGLTFNTNYTYSHTISDSDNEFHTSALNPRRAQDTNRLGQDRSNSDLNVTHKFALSLTYDLPKTPFANRFAKALLDGYGLGTAVLIQSGQPVTIQSGIDSNGNIDSAGDRAILNQAGTGNVSGEPGQGDVLPVCEGAGGATYIGSTSYLAAPLNGCNANNAAPFGFDPAIGYTPVNANDKYVIAGGAALPNIGRNSFFSPGFWTWNLAVHKDVHFSESKYLQLSASAFNLLNHPNYALSNGNVFNAGGSTTALSTPDYVLPFTSNPNFLDPKQFGGGIRSMILGAKFIF
jgi:Carboxypeptidase regulatory-like domain/TonB dependent receptor-like, beta-barrel